VNWRASLPAPINAVGARVSAGLRIRVKGILDLLAAGASREEILGDFPFLEAADITAALEFAAGG
jgi:uncharacterized protein (DUF433 family)